MAKSKGRPKKHPTKVLSERMELRLTTAERLEFEQAAERAELSVSEWVRECLLKAARRSANSR